jgi:hypothetical protein
MAGAIDLAGMVPGFDFLQGLMKGGGAALPAMGQWVAPTLDPKELEKRIGELRTVQFWLEQNAKLLGATIQALEVQRMTLATLQTMNLPMADLRDSLRINVPTAAAPASAAASAAPAAPPAKPKPDASAPATAGTPAVDPLQWWGALTQQFTDLAAQALKDTAATAAAAQPTKSPAAAPAAARKARAAPAKTATKRTR